LCNREFKLKKFYKIFEIKLIIKFYFKNFFFIYKKDKISTRTIKNYKENIFFL